MFRLTAIALLFGCAQHSAIAKSNARVLRGVIQDESGRLASHAIVELTPLNGSAELRADTTDERGRFLVSGLEPGAYRVRVARVGLRQLIWDHVIGPSSPESLQVTLLNSDRGLLVCSPKPPVGLQLVLRDAQTGLFIEDSVLAVAQAENYAETLRRRHLPTSLRVPVHEGVPSRAGGYQVSVHHPRFEEVRFPVLLAASSCGVTPVLLEVFLTPLR
ncbi:MAG TPA: carboxypeptidase-like regulatory domain-containing protein [Gemmatimonadaceae bacterium]|nr:carboxypeptidase-like regulatory domain-containing protein [Gemmatimonadaceae bacterium]